MLRIEPEPCLTIPYEHQQADSFISIAKRSGICMPSDHFAIDYHISMTSSLGLPRQPYSDTNFATQ